MVRKTQEAVHQKTPLTTVIGNNLHFPPIILPNSSLSFATVHHKVLFGFPRPLSKDPKLKQFWCLSWWRRSSIYNVSFGLQIYESGIHPISFIHYLYDWLFSLLRSSRSLDQNGNFLDSDACLMISKFCLNKSHKFKSKIFTFEFVLISKRNNDNTYGNPLSNLRMCVHQPWNQ